MARTPAPGATKVVATSSWVDDDGTRLPAGQVHAWVPGTNQTVCGVPLHRARLDRFSHVSWADAQPATGGSADRVSEVCPRCHAGTGGRRDERRWTRRSPRP